MKRLLGNFVLTNMSKICSNSNILWTDEICSILTVYDILTCILLPGTNRYFRQVATRMKIETSFVDATDVSQVQKAMKPNTKVGASLIIVSDFNWIKFLLTRRSLDKNSVMFKQAWECSVF